LGISADDRRALGSAGVAFSPLLRFFNTGGGGGIPRPLAANSENPPPLPRPKSRTASKEEKWWFDIGITEMLLYTGASGSKVVGAGLLGARNIPKSSTLKVEEEEDRNAAVGGEKESMSTRPNRVAVWESFSAHSAEPLELGSEGTRDLSFRFSSSRLKLFDPLLFIAK